MITQGNKKMTDSIIKRALQNKSGKARKTTTSMGNKYITEAKRGKNGSVSHSTKPIKRAAGRSR